MMLGSEVAMIWWWMPFMAMLEPVETGTDVSGFAAADRRQHAKIKVKAGYGEKGDQPRRKAKANTKRKAAGKTAGRKGAARKSVRKTRTKRR